MHQSRLQRAAFAGAMMLGAAVASAQAPSDVVGCYVAKPALTYSATGGPEREDSSWASVQLSEDGKARRPLLPRRYDRSSSWLLGNDTLVATFFDGLVGWRLRLTRAPHGWTGEATYLTDVIVVGLKPYQHALTLTRRSCAPSA